MILSFSVPEMRPMIEAGIRQAMGEDVGDARVKRQTIRMISGPTSPWLRLIADPAEYRLQHWWKQRSKAERAFLGDLPCQAARPITIRNDGGVIQIMVPPIRIRLLADFAYADGFDDLDAFREYFVPKPGDVYGGDEGAVLIKW